MPVLVVQMGHVGRPPCPGSVGTAGEQDFTTRAGAACVRLLNQGGWIVRVIDADPNYSAVPKLGGNPDYYRGDAFVAIHCDGSTNPARDGASFGYRTGGNTFAQTIKAAYLRRTGRPASWLEPDNYTTNLAQYYGTGIATSVGNTRAVIFETGFLTNPTDRAMLLAPSGPDNVALAIGDALGIAQPVEDDMDWEDRISVANPKDRTHVETHAARQIIGDGYFYASGAYTLAAEALKQVQAMQGALPTQQAALLAAIEADRPVSVVLSDEDRDDIVRRIVDATTVEQATAAIDELGRRLAPPVV